MQIKYKYGDKVFLHKLKLPGTYITIDDDLALVEYVDGIKMIKAKFNLGEISLYDENYKATKLRKDKNNPLQIKVKYFDDTLPKIEKIKQGNWIDLRAGEDVELKQFEFKLIPLGVGMKLPDGYEANVVPRSSTFKNFGIIQTNSMGVVDNSYSGNSDQWFFPALAMRDTQINYGDRICQFRINEIMPDVEIIEVESLDEISRGGHGSTGVL